MKRRLTTKEFIEKATKIHSGFYTYTKVKYLNAHEKVIITCPIHGDFLQSPHNHTHNEQGCMQCGAIITRKSRLNTLNDFLQKAKALHKNKYDYSKVNYEKCDIKICIICQTHGEFYQMPESHLVGSGCPKCVSKISKPEIDFLNYCQIPDDTNHRQKYISPYKVDAIYQNIIYEFLGDYWHGNPTKFSPKDINELAHKTFGELHTETFHKFRQLNQRGYKIRYIWERDWKQFRRGIDSAPKIMEYI